MNPENTNTTRREFLKTAGIAAAGLSVLGSGCETTNGTNLSPERGAHVASTETIQVALVGCGGRGTGAASQAVSVKRGPVKIVAMADVFEDRLNSSFDGLSKDFGAHMDVPQDRKFIGFDAYKKAMDCLKPGDVVILTTPLAFRWVHFTYAIEKKLNVFMEKPLTADGPCSRRMLKLAEDATAKNLKVGVGLNSRHSRAMEQLADRIHGGEIGEIILMRGYRMAGPVAACFSPRKPKDVSEVEYQIRRFHSFIWASGGLFNDFNIHIIDHLCWMKNAWPVKAQAVGGRHYRGDDVDQNFDSYSVEYTFDDGTKMFMDGRNINGCNDLYSSHAHGTKGMAIVSKSGDCGMPSSTFKTQKPTKDGLIWTSQVAPDEENPYQNEWNDLINAIRDDKPYNEVPRAVTATVVTSMGRVAAHTGQEITYDDFLNDVHEYAPNVDKMTLDGPAPVMSDADGKYPVPQPGICTKTEYPM